MFGRVLAAAALATLFSASPALAAPDLTITATHARATLLRVAGTNTTVNPGTLTLVVRNGGADPTSGTVTVANPLPTGLTALINDYNAGAGPVAASGTGWTCVTTTCTRSDALAPGASYPPIKVTVRTANTAPASVTNAPTVSGGGDDTPGSASDVIPIVLDACPNGWSPDEKVKFGPPVPAVDSGVMNVEREDGCSALDLIWDAEPFASHEAFVAHVDGVAATFGYSQNE